MVNLVRYDFLQFPVMHSYQRTLRRSKIYILGDFTSRLDLARRNVCGTICVGTNEELTCKLRYEFTI
jgi:hypothetical protein